MDIPACKSSFCTDHLPNLWTESTSPSDPYSSVPLVTHPDHVYTCISPETGGRDTPDL